MSYPKDVGDIINISLGAPAPKRKRRKYRLRRPPARRKRERIKSQPPIEDGPLSQEYLENVGFIQVKGAPQGVLERGDLQVRPVLIDKWDDVHWSVKTTFDGQDWHVVLPLALTPKTQLQTQSLLHLMGLIANE